MERNWTHPLLLVNGNSTDEARSQSISPTSPEDGSRKIFLGGDLLASGEDWEEDMSERIKKLDDEEFGLLLAGGKDLARHDKEGVDYREGTMFKGPGVILHEVLVVRTSSPRFPSSFKNTLDRTD